MYPNRNAVYAPGLVACRVRAPCVLSGSVFRGAESSSCWWLVLGLRPLGPGPAPLRILV